MLGTFMYLVHGVAVQNVHIKLTKPLGAFMKSLGSKILKIIKTTPVKFH